MTNYTLYELIAKAGDATQFSSNVTKSQLDLAYLGIPYEAAGRTFTDIRGALAKQCDNDKVTVPTLVSDDGLTITDSWKIAEYLEEHHAKPAGKSLFGGTVEGKAFCKFIEQWSANTMLVEIRPILGPLIWTTLQEPCATYYLTKKAGCTLDEMHARLAKLRDPAFIDQTCATARTRLAPLETLLQGHKDEGRPLWINGTGPSHADFCVFGAYAFSRLNDDAIKGVWQHPSLPRVGEWVKGMLESGLIKESELPSNVDYTPPSA